MSGGELATINPCTIRNDLQDVLAIPKFLTTQSPMNINSCMNLYSSRIGGQNKGDSALSSGRLECVRLVPNKLRHGLVQYRVCITPSKQMGQPEFFSIFFTHHRGWPQSK
jgi:hypothetical protein